MNTIRVWFFAFVGQDPHVVDHFMPSTCSKVQKMVRYMLQQFPARKTLMMICFSTVSGCETSWQTALLKIPLLRSCDARCRCKDEPKDTDASHLGTQNDSVPCSVLSDLTNLDTVGYGIVIGTAAASRQCGEAIWRDQSSRRTIPHSGSIWHTQVRAPFVILLCIAASHSPIFLLLTAFHMEADPLQATNSLAPSRQGMSLPFRCWHRAGKGLIPCYLWRGA